MSKQRLSVHLRVYRGKTLTYNAKGESTNENHIVKLDYDTQEYKRFLSMLKANGFIKADVEKVLDINKPTKEGYEEIEDLKYIQEEVEKAINPDGAEKELTEDQKRIAALEAKIEELTGGKKADSKDGGKTAEPKKELTEEEKTELKTLRDEYVELNGGKKGHPGWGIDELKAKIEELKAK